MKLVVIGAQWGDEGKGKIVDFLAEGADIVARFSGGANAGHTIVHGGHTYKLHLVPSGIVYPQKQVVLGTGMVIDPQALEQELSELSAEGVSWQGRVFISDRAHLVLPRYKRADKELDKSRTQPIGTTGRGIGVTYSTKAARDGVRVIDAFDEELLEALSEEDRSFLLEHREAFRDMVVDINAYMSEHADTPVLLEGAQGALLDLDLGTYPFVSSGCSAAGGAAVGGGFGPREIDRVIGVCKAYSTRVGNGPFPTEFTAERDGDLEHVVRELGHEYGVTTGRPRRCGYLDLVALAYACRSNSLDALALTHLDIYDTFDEVTVCVAYRINGRQTRYFPASRSAIARAEPILETLSGWKSSTAGARRVDELPAEARELIRYIESYTGVPVEIISVGSEREHTIVERDPWTQS
ncbi:MAG: adenylosuccinate synthase [Spirochaetaceae bacterium]